MFKGVELRAVNGTRERGLAMSKATSDKGDDQGGGGDEASVIDDAKPVRSATRS
jgi:hypothetical protein